MSFAKDLAWLWQSRGFRKLATTRLVSQAGDGMFQVGIATTFFFEPEKAGSPAEIAQGFFLLLAPFTIVGPFVGPFIDRWPRQRILFFGNLARLVLVGGIVAALATHAPTWVLFTLALLALSINRFLLASMTAGLPKVVERDELLTANAILPTLGTVAAFIGGAVGTVAATVLPNASGLGLAFFALVGACTLFGLSSLLSMRLRRDELGPDERGTVLSFWGQVKVLLIELREGLRYLRARVTPAQALGVMAAQRLLYGLMTVSAILISRHVLADPDNPEGAIEKFGVVLGFAAVGFGLASVLTPTYRERIDRYRWILMCLIVGAVGQTFLVVSPEPWALLTAAVVVSFAVQGGKIAVDTIVQRDTEDAVRGRAFTIYDMAYNIAFVSSAAIGALVLPDDGYSRIVMGGMVVAYLVIAAVFVRARREPLPAPELLLR